MTRSLGDSLAKRIGVIGEPEIIYHELTEDDKFMIIASDGVWEFVSNEKAIEIVNKHYTSKDVERAGRELAEYSRKLWEKVNRVIHLLEKPGSG